MFTSNRPRKRPTSSRSRKLLGQKPPLKLKEVWAIRIRLQLTGRPVQFELTEQTRVSLAF
jgi:hypothetical protein